MHIHRPCRYVHTAHCCIPCAPSVTPRPPKAYHNNFTLPVSDHPDEGSAGDYINSFFKDEPTPDLLSRPLSSLTENDIFDTMRSTVRSKLFLIVTLAFAAVFTVSATQVMHRPENYKDSPHKFAQGNATPHVIHKRAGAKVNMAYFTNWSVDLRHMLQVNY